MTLPPVAAPRETIEESVMAVGHELLAAIGDVVGEVARPGTGPVAAARLLEVDKVLMSRVLKALRAGDTVGGLSAMPGPEPLRRLVAQATSKKLLRPGMAERALAAIERYERLIKHTLGDRSRLDSLLSVWAPGARREFELRRKQAAFKALSQIKGVQAEINHATVMLSPSADPERIDVVWVTGVLGLMRLRPGAALNFASRRVATGTDARRPLTLDGSPVDAGGGGEGDGGGSMLVKEFCSRPTPRLKVTRVEQSLFYAVQDEALGAADAVDLVYAEVNRAEIPRYVPSGSGRRGYFFAEVNIPCAVLQFDVLMHRELYPGREAELVMYDTAFHGVASVNDRTRDIDRLDLLESADALGGPPLAGRLRSPDVPRYADLIAHAGTAAGFDLGEFRGFRTRIDYPLYGSQVTMAFAAEEHG
jgi:hypothetical protein